MIIYLPLQSYCRPPCEQTAHLVVVTSQPESNDSNAPYRLPLPTGVGEDDVTACEAFVDGGLEDQDGDLVPANGSLGAFPFTLTADGQGQVFKQLSEFVYLGEAITAGCNLRSVDVTRRLQSAWSFFREA